jgi:hypothetical protein
MTFMPTGLTGPIGWHDRYVLTGIERCWFVEGHARVIALFGVNTLFGDPTREES